MPYYRGQPEEVDASGGFIEHHEQYEELFQSKHVALDCIECHMPRVTKSAVGNAAMYIGDLRTHLMAIDATLTEQFTYHVRPAKL